MIDVFGAELNNSNFWEIEQFVIRQAQLGMVGTTQGYYPIPDFTIPLFQRSRVMAAQFQNLNARPTWRLGCYLKQSIPAPFATDPTDFSDIISWRIPLRSLQIFFPSTCTNPWQLRASIPYWHEEARLTIYRFTGAVNEPLLSQVAQILNLMS